MSDLLNKVLSQIQKDIEAEDLTAIEELLTHVPYEYLVGYLPEAHPCSTLTT